MTSRRFRTVGSTILFRKLNVGNTLDIVNRCVTPVDVPLPQPAGLA